MNKLTGNKAHQADIFEKYAPFSRVEKSEVGIIYLDEVEKEMENLINDIQSTVADKNHTHEQLIVMITRLSVLRGIVKRYKGKTDEMNSLTQSLTT